VSFWRSAAFAEYRSDFADNVAPVPLFFAPDKARQSMWTLSPKDKELLFKAFSKELIALDKIKAHNRLLEEERTHKRLRE
jgi:hypothetical protein